MTALVLFRGDAQKIVQFDFHKTDKFCMVGQGVYLTNALSVAQTYRTKGLGYNRPYSSEILFSGSAKDRPDALNKAFDRYFDEHLSNNRLHQIHKSSSKKVQDKVRAEVRATFDERVDDGRICASYDTGYSQERRLRVTQVVEPDVGYVTEFSFNKEVFEATTPNVDGVIKDTQFWEILWDHKFTEFGQLAPSREEFINVNTRDHRYSLDPGWGKKSFNGTSAEVYNRMRRILSPYGYRGFEYQGGVSTGGTRHRAFCLWDAEFVNDHKVRRFR